MIQWISDNYDYVSPRSIPDNTVIGLRIGDFDYDNGQDNQICIHTQVLQGFMVKELPINLEIIPCYSFDDMCINPSYNVDNFFYDGNNIVCTYTTAIKTNELTNLYDQSDLLYFDKIRANAASNGYKVSISPYDDSKYLSFSATFPADGLIENVLCKIAMLSENIFADTLKSPLYHLTDLTDISERDFTISYVIPALEKIGYLGVSYNHGFSEFGKDIIYHRFNDFGQLIYGAAQVKSGNISGNATSKLYEISSQIETAFSVPSKDISSRSDISISEVIVICSGEFTSSATDIIVGSFKGRSVIFVDGKTIINILNK